MTCPCCGTDFPWEAGLAEADAKRLAVALGAMEPALALAAISYLRFFKPQKTTLRLPRAIKLLHELAALADAGTVCRDERTGVQRPAPASVWVAAIDQMQQQAERLVLPLTGHGYLREVVFGLADKADALAERQRERALRDAPRAIEPPRSTQVIQEDRLTSELRFITQMHSYGQISDAERDRQMADARAKSSAKRAEVTA